MTILGIDTSNKEMVLSLFEEDKIIATYMTSQQKNHSKTLMPAIEFLCASNNVEPKALTKIVVAKGPGSYTGLRIAVTTAKTIAWTLGIDLFSVSSLAVIASSHPMTSSIVVPLINARRNNVYTSAYEWKDGQLKNRIQDTHIALSSWLDTLKGLDENILFVGSDVSEFKQAIEEMNEPNFTVSNQLISSNLNGDSFLRLKKNWQEVKNIHGFVPSYLKKVEAEEKWLETAQGDEEIRYVERL